MPVKTSKITTNQPQSQGHLFKIARLLLYLFLKKNFIAAGVLPLPRCEVVQSAPAVNLRDEHAGAPSRAPVALLGNTCAAAAPHPRVRGAGADCRRCSLHCLAALVRVQSLKGFFGTRVRTPESIEMGTEQLAALQSWVKSSQRLMRDADAFTSPEMAAAVLQMKRATQAAVSSTKNVVDLEQKRAVRQQAEARQKKNNGAYPKQNLSPHQLDWMEELSVGRGEETDADKFTTYQLQIMAEQNAQKNAKAGGRSSGGVS